MMTRDLARRVSLAVSLVASAMALNSAGAQATASAAVAPAGQASTLAGKWEGNLFVQGQQIAVVITLDSAAAGWSGTLLVSAINPTAINMASVVVKKDTVSMTLPEEGYSAFLQGLLSTDKKTLNGMLAVQGDNTGSFAVTKVVAAAKSPKHD